MKTHEITKYIQKHLQVQLPGYTVGKSLVYKVENTFFLRGYSFESAGNDNYDLAVWCFIQPLFIKSDCLYFNFGDRLKQRQKVNVFKRKKMEWWNATAASLDETFISILQSIRTDGEKYLRSFKTSSDFYRRFKPKIDDDVITNEAVTYTSVLLDDDKVTERMLKNLIRFCEKEIRNDYSPVEIRIKKDATRLLEAGTQEKRLEILKDWANETINHLNLTG